MGFEPKVRVSQAIPKLALAGATREKTIQEVDGLLPGPAGLLRLATITPRLQFGYPRGRRMGPTQAPQTQALKMSYSKFLIALKNLILPCLSP